MNSMTGRTSPAKCFNCPAAAELKVAGRHLPGTQLAQPPTQLPGRLHGKSNREDPVGLERSSQYLVRNPASDRRRLAGAGAGKNAERSPNRLNGAPLLGIQTFKYA